MIFMILRRVDVKYISNMLFRVLFEKKQVYYSLLEIVSDFKFVFMIANSVNPQSTPVFSIFGDSKIKYSR